VLPWTSASPTTLRVCSSADGPGLLHRGVPPQAFPKRPVAAQGVHSPGLPPALSCREMENLSTSYMRSILHQVHRFVKGLGYGV
jgi:hypothetical protein